MHCPQREGITHNAFNRRTIEWILPQGLLALNVVRLLHNHHFDTSYVIGLLLGTLLLCHVSFKRDFYSSSDQPPPPSVPSSRASVRPPRIVFPNDDAVTRAIQNDDYHQVKKLLSWGAKANLFCMEKAGPSLLLFPLQPRTETISTVKCLLRNVAEIDAHTPLTSETSLINAAGAGHVSTVQRLPCHDTSMNAESVLWESVLAYSLSVLSIENDVFARSTRGGRVNVHISAYLQRAPLVVATEYGFGGYSLATGLGCHEDIAVQGNDGCTTLHYAMRMNHLMIVRVLMERKALT